MSQNLKNGGKLLCILLGLLFLFFLWQYQKEDTKEIPQGETIPIADVRILLQALDLPVSEDLFAALKQEEMLTYEQYRKIYDAVGGAELGLPDFADTYELSYKILKTDWYEAFDRMLAYLDTESTIWKTTIFIIRTDTENKKLYTENAEYEYLSPSFADSAFCKEEVYVKGRQLLTSLRKLDEKTILENVWVMETTGNTMDCFYHQTAFTIKADQPVERERIADLTFEKGSLVKTAEKSKKVHGRILQVSDSAVVLEGLDTYEIAEHMECYKLYGSLETLSRKDLLLGYDYTDFVLDEQGKICAALVVREGEPDKIRVLLKNTVKSSYFYDTAEIEADGVKTTLRAEEMKEGERISFQTKALTDKVILIVEDTEKTENAYRGNLEVCKLKQGIIIVNELPLEEYLYAVVPSEMPASYPMEALKAQAVCARTYAYRYMLHAGLSEYGAHLDDTTAYQVYHNIGENAASTTAVKETAGRLLYHGEELAQNYYYSTSCGYGTDTNVWKGEKTEDTSYIRAGKYAKAANQLTKNTVMADDMTDGMTGRQTPEEMIQEENFAAFIQTKDEADFEKDEAWYRWQYTVEEIDTSKIEERLQSRFVANPALVLTKKGEEAEAYYVSEPMTELGEIKNLEIVKRGVGGVADELVITGSKITVKVVSEYNIRSVLCDGESEVIRQDNSHVKAAALLPSGFFIIETRKKQENVIGYTLTGGGYGHGVGMSQNGAKAMGSLGYGYQEILAAFFTDCEVR